MGMRDGDAPCPACAKRHGRDVFGQVSEGECPNCGTPIRVVVPIHALGAPPYGWFFARQSDAYWNQRTIVEPPRVGVVVVALATPHVWVCDEAALLRVAVEAVMVYRADVMRTPLLWANVENLVRAKDYAGVLAIYRNAEPVGGVSWHVLSQKRGGTTEEFIGLVRAVQP